ncbi:MAG: dehydrogenase [Rhodospirillales bacterium 70-18]|nr:NAD(P)H-dependent oxidoreductase [Rhodospirillales bacterium]OJY65837.1 MAG: dehydrogenase [Rhodospirillales bacterium 70-18]
MGMRILVIQGHPDPAGGHFCHALAHAYAEGASAAGHEVRRLSVAGLALPVLRSEAEWQGPAPPDVAASQRDIVWAEHLVFVYPLWLGGMPALLKAFLEQVARPGFAFDAGPNRSPWQKKLAGRSARIVVTMGMPALVYRWYFGAHSLKSLERNILGFIGIEPIRESLVGMVGAADPARRTVWLAKLRRLGAKGR